MSAFTTDEMLLLDTAIPWAAIGAGLAGAGSFLTGLAALRSASHKEEEHQEHETEIAPEAGDVADR